MNRPDTIEALFQQASTGDIEALTSTLQERPNLASSTNQQGISLLLWAMYHRQVEAAKLIYPCLPTPDIHSATAVNDVDGIRVLLNENETVLNARSADGFTPLHYACFFGNADCAGLLIERGAEVNTPANNPSGVYPLHSAAACQSTIIVKLLLDNGADPNVQQRGGYTALMSAAMHNNQELISLLLLAGADRCKKDEKGQTAYDYGKEKGFEIEQMKAD